MDNLNPKQKTIIISLWIFCLIAFYAVATSFATLKVHKDKVDSQKRHLNRMASDDQEEGRTWVQLDSLKLQQHEEATKVNVGIYVDHIVDLSTKNTNWTVDFYIWFRWQDPSIQPGENFQVMNGEILSRELVDSKLRENEKYELYRVVAKITKFFNVVRYPRDNHLLTICIENEKYTWQQMQFVADSSVSDISSRAKLPGYEISRSIMVTKPHPYKTNRGDPSLKNDHMAVYDQAIYGLEISRPDWGLYFKMFQSMFASVAIALLVFIMNPRGEGRVSLGIGAFFASVASSYISTTELPGIGVLTLSDIINIFGMATIFLSVLSSIIAMQLAKDEKHIALAKLFDKVSLGVFLASYITANILIAQIASL